MFTRALHWSLSWARSIQSILPHSNSLRSIIILSFYLRLGLPSGLFPFGFPTKNPICIPLPPQSCYMPCPSHPRWLDNSNYTWRIIQAMKLVIMQPPITSSLFGPNIFLSTLFSNTLSLCSSLNVRDQVSHPYRTTTRLYKLNLWLVWMNSYTVHGHMHFA
jgi:hypothetical protein